MINIYIYIYVYRIYIYIYITCIIYIYMIHIYVYIYNPEQLPTHRAMNPILGSRGPFASWDPGTWGMGLRRRNEMIANFTKYHLLYCQILTVF